MTEYDFLCRMLCPSFIIDPEADGSYRLVEDKKAGGKADHIVRSIPQPALEGTALFRFSLDNFDFLPFFNNPPKRGGSGPQNLKKFCDYIMLAHDGSHLRIMLIEMKRAKKDPEMGEQLRASELFMRYVIDTAERIKHANGSDDFDPERITVHRICLKEFPGMKMTSHPKEIIRQAADGKIATLTNHPYFNPRWAF